MKETKDPDEWTMDSDYLPGENPPGKDRLPTWLIIVFVVIGIASLTSMC